MKKILVLVGTLLSTLATTSQAFDAKREGFQIGAGFGAHSSSLNAQNNPALSSHETEQKLAVDFQLGYGFSNRIVGFIGGKGGSVMVNGLDATVAISGVGGTLYWADTSPSLYLTGLAGIGSLSMNDENADQRDSGAGWLVGAGFELAKGLHLELSYARADLVDPQNDSITSALESTFATVKYVWY